MNIYKEPPSKELSEHAQPDTDSLKDESKDDDSL